MNAAGHANHASSWSVVMACINPHGFGFAGTFESALAVKVEGTPVCDEDVLVKPFIARHKQPHELCADTTPLIIWKYE